MFALSLGSSVDLLGFLAAILTTAAFVPQVVKTWKSKSAEDLSLSMLATFTTGVFLWFLYGLAIGSAPVTVANFLTLLQSGVLVALRIRFRRR
jgi:MtN3 and saliva related transmembrane protein